VNRLMALDPYWVDYVDFYVHEPGYWYQPKGLAITRGNLPLIKKRLAVLRRYEGTNWGAAQFGYTRTLARERLINLSKPLRDYTNRDSFALARMNKVVFTSLGLAWVDPGDNVYITPFGRMFLKTRQSLLPQLVADQLYKFQLRNPSLSGVAQSLTLFPHCFLLQLLAWFPDGISRGEYILFVSRSLAPNDLPRVVERIERYRALDDDQRKQLWQKLARIPLIKGGRVQIKGKRSSLLNTIRLDAAYVLDLHAIPDYLEGTRDNIRIKEARRGEVAQLVHQHNQQAWFVDYENELDWISVYGDPERHGSIVDAVEYYEKRNRVAKASEALLAGTRRGLIRERVRPDEYTERRVREKLLEIYLADNLHELEDGLEFLGRQLSTPTGPLDLLARDRRGRFVVIELKRDRAADKVVAQLQRYVGHIRTEHSTGPRGVRGMIVGRRIDRALRAAVSGNVTFAINLYQHDTQFHANIRPVSLN